MLSKTAAIPFWRFLAFRWVAANQAPIVASCIKGRFQIPPDQSSARLSNIRSTLLERTRIPLAPGTRTTFRPRAR